MKSKLTAYSLQLIERLKSRISVFLLEARSYKLEADSRGFTLVEMIVATALFAVVMLVSVGALLSLIDANRKAQALHSVMDNLNIALDSMVRSIRMGSTYHCGSEGFVDYSVARDCASEGDTVLAIEPFGGDPDDAEDQWVYSFEEDESGIGRIYKSYKAEDDTLRSLPITAPSVSIDSMKFYVAGAGVSGDTTQPKVVITLKGTAGAEKVKTTTTFNIQATAVQRILDL